MKKENNLNISDYLNEYLDTGLKYEVFERLEAEMREESTLNDWINFLNDIVNQGLEFGIVKSMFYTDDVEKFTLENFNQIVDLVNELEINIKVEYNLLTKLADFSFEYICSEILDVLEKLKDEIKIECLA